ncbi:hypothetical protein VNO80_04194 [Phaseolus coccineus]|uniref:Uncharacterized protein n=1 Tax=Phaseolus coccineus TaxID=3886 RepID=A0AAN9NTQ9_PHACN
MALVGVRADNLIYSGSVQAQLSAKSWVGETLIFDPVADVATQLWFDGYGGATNRVEGSGRACGGYNGEAGGEQVGVSVGANLSAMSTVAHDAVEECARGSDDVTFLKTSEAGIVGLQNVVAGAIVDARTEARDGAL